MLSQQIPFINKVKDYRASLHLLFPETTFKKVRNIDMSTSLPPSVDYDTVKDLGKQVTLFQQQYPEDLLANGYLENRMFYNTEVYKRIENNKTEYRSIHLGTDFWVPAQTPVHSPFEGKVVILHDNNYPKDYGPTVVLKHHLENSVFYTLYGHLSRVSLEVLKKDQLLLKGDKIGFIGDDSENGNWFPHLHFQIITDLLRNTNNFPGVAFPSEIERWKSICPDPSQLFIENF